MFVWWATLTWLAASWQASCFLTRGAWYGSSVANKNGFENRGPLILSLVRSKCRRSRLFAETDGSGGPSVSDILAQKDESVKLEPRKDMRFRSVIARKVREGNVEKTKSITSAAGGQRRTYFQETFLPADNPLANTTSFKDVMLIVEDLDRSVKFYQDILNMTMLDRTWIENCEGALMSIPGGTKKSLRLWLMRDKTLYPPYNDLLGYFGIEMHVPRFGLRFIKHFKERIESLGGSIKQGRELCYEPPIMYPLPDPKDKGTYFVTAYLEDPDGYPVMMFEKENVKENRIPSARFHGEDLWRINNYYKQLFGMKVAWRRLSAFKTYYPFDDTIHSDRQATQAMYYHYGDVEEETGLELFMSEQDTLWRTRGFEGMVFYTTNLTAALDWLRTHNRTANTISIQDFGSTTPDNYHTLFFDYENANRRLDYQWQQINSSIREQIAPDLSRDPKIRGQVTGLAETEEVQNMRKKLLFDALASVDSDFFGAIYPEKRLFRIWDGTHVPTSLSNATIPVHFKFAARFANATKIGFWTDIDGYQTALIQPNLH